MGQLHRFILGPVRVVLHSQQPGQIAAIQRQQLARLERFVQHPFVVHVRIVVVNVAHVHRFVERRGQGGRRMGVHAGDQLPFAGGVQPDAGPTALRFALRTVPGLVEFGRRELVEAVVVDDELLATANAVDEGQAVAGRRSGQLVGGGRRIEVGGFQELVNVCAMCGNIDGRDGEKNRVEH